MALKVGDSCYTIVWKGTRIEYWKYILRTIRTRNSTVYGYWWCKLPGVTWGKVSKKAGDYGWLPDAHRDFCTKHRLSQGRPYAASKLGALRDEIADLRCNIEGYGADCHFYDDDGPTLGEHLKIAIAAQKRRRKEAS